MTDAMKRAALTIPEQAVALLPCPFCGSAPATAGAKIFCGNDECFGPQTTAGTLQSSAEQWNTRAALPLVGVQRPEDVARVLKICHPDMPNHDFSTDAAEIAKHTGQPGLGDLNFLKAFWRAQPSCLHLACVADCNPLTTHCGRTADVAAEHNVGQPQEGREWAAQIAEREADEAQIENLEHGYGALLTPLQAYNLGRKSVAGDIRRAVPAPQAGCAKEAVDDKLSQIIAAKMKEPVFVEMQERDAANINWPRYLTVQKVGPTAVSDWIVRLLPSGREIHLRGDEWDAALASPLLPVAESGWQEGERAALTELDLASAIQKGADKGAEQADEYCSGAMALSAAREVIALLSTAKL